MRGGERVCGCGVVDVVVVIVVVFCASVSPPKTLKMTFV